jgi:hypothetical protein
MRCGLQPLDAKPLRNTTGSYAFYNTERPHQALGNKTPIAILREAATGRRGHMV